MVKNPNKTPYDPNKPLQKRTKEAQHVFIKHYAVNRNISAACEHAKVSRTVYYEWLSKFPKFKQKCQDVIDKFDDIIEDGLFHYAKAKNPDILKFLAKHRLSKRGYTEKQEVEHSGEIATKAYIGFSPDEWDEETK